MKCKYFIIITILLGCDCFPISKKGIVKIRNPFYESVYYDFRQNIKKNESVEIDIWTINWICRPRFPVKNEKLVLYYKSTDCPFAVYDLDDKIFYNLLKFSSPIGTQKEKKIYNKELIIIKTGLTDKNEQDIAEKEKQEPLCLNIENLILKMQL